jgi:hypothetical protein
MQHLQLRKIERLAASTEHGWYLNYFAEETRSLLNLILLVFQLAAN